MCQWCSRIKLVYKFSRAAARLTLSVSLRGIMSKRVGKKSKKRDVCMCVHLQ